MTAVARRRFSRLSLILGLCGLGALLNIGMDAMSATACAQGTPTTAIPTLGPIDPACSRVPDTDNDSVLDYEDNCHRYFNPGQEDVDKDSGEPPYEPVPVSQRNPTTGGDACDTDDDGDGLPDVRDNCRKIPNADQADEDRDGFGDRCDTIDAGGPAASAKRPKLTISGFARRHRVAEIRAGVTVPVRCDVRCGIAAELRVDSRTARRLGVKTLLGSTIAGLERAGSTFVFVKVPAKTLSRISRSRSVRATLTLRASNDAGRAALVTRRLTLTR